MYSWSMWKVDPDCFINSHPHLHSEAEMRLEKWKKKTQSELNGENEGRMQWENNTDTMHQLIYKCI